MIRGCPSRTNQRPVSEPTRDDCAILRSALTRDGRTLDRATLETMRTMAGERPSKVIARYGFHRCTIYGWLKAAQERRVFRWVNGKTPRQYGFDVGV